MDLRSQLLPLSGWGEVSGGVEMIHPLWMNPRMAAALNGQCMIICYWPGATHGKSFCTEYQPMEIAG